MLDINATIDLWAGGGNVPKWDGDTLRVSSGPLEVVLHLTGDDKADWCLNLAGALIGKAEELGVEHRTAQHNIATMTGYIADLRRDKGEIADDGWCWDCKAGNHDGHKPYNEGRCYGCACDHENLGVR